MWQDYVNSFISIILSYALIPQAIKGFREKKPNISKQSGIISTLGLYGYAYSAYTLDLKLTSLTALVSGTMWGVLTVQSFIYKPKLEEELK